MLCVLYGLSVGFVLLSFLEIEKERAREKSLKHSNFSFHFISFQLIKNETMNNNNIHSDTFPSILDVIIDVMDSVDHTQSYEINYFHSTEVVVEE